MGLEQIRSRVSKKSYKM